MFHKLQRFVLPTGAKIMFEDFFVSDNFVGKNKWYYENTLKKNGVERILCAAVWYKNFPIKIFIDANVRPYNINEGIVFCGHRHPHCIYTAASISGLAQHELTWKDGFLTNCNRFVDRIEAAELAWNAGQLEKKPMLNEKWIEIFSEDLY